MLKDTSIQDRFDSIAILAQCEIEANIFVAAKLLDRSHFGKRFPESASKFCIYFCNTGAFTLKRKRTFSRGYNFLCLEIKEPTEKLLFVPLRGLLFDKTPRGRPR